MATFFETGLSLHTKDESMTKVKLVCNNNKFLHAMSVLQIHINFENVLSNNSSN